MARGFLDSEQKKAKSGYEESLSSVVRPREPSLNRLASGDATTDERPATLCRWKHAVRGPHSGRVDVKELVYSPDRRLSAPARLSSLMAFQPPIVVSVASSSQQ